MKNTFYIIFLFIFSFLAQMNYSYAGTIPVENIQISKSKKANKNKYKSKVKKEETKPRNYAVLSFVILMIGIGFFFLNIVSEGFIIVFLLAVFTSFILSVIGLGKKNKKKGFAIASLAFTSIFILLMLISLLFGSFE